MHSYYKAALLLCLTFLLFYPGFLFHWPATQDPYIFGADARQYIPVFDTYLPGSAIPQSYTKQYYHDALMLPGYRQLYQLAAEYWDAHALARQLPYLLYLLSTAVMIAAAWRVGGALTAGGVLVLSLSTGFILQWSYGGGTSRMFAFTFIALALWTLAANRPYMLALCTVVAAFFYPLAAAICGVSLALWLLLLRGERQELASRWPLSKRLLIVLVTFCLTVAAVVPTMLAGGEYGRRVVGDDIVTWPEASSTGRYRIPGDAVPYAILNPRQIAGYLVAGLNGYGSPLLPALSLRQQFPTQAMGGLLIVAGMVLAATILGMKKLVEQTPGAIRLIVPFVAAVLLYIAAFVLQPYLYIPGRYLVYTVPLWACFLFPLGLFGLSQANGSRHSHLIVWVPVAIIFLLWGGRGDARIDWTIVIPEEQREFYRQVSALPDDVLIAGWPGSRTLDDINMDNIAFLTRRNVLLNQETHQVLHMKYMQEMRRRMEAIAAAYFATDAAPLLKLKEDYGVTHFLVDGAHFSGNPPTYFAPWSEERIRTMLEAANGRAYLADPALYKRAGVVRQGDTVLLDMAKIDEPAQLGGSR